MATEQQFKRHTALKLRIGDVLVGKPVIINEKFAFIELGNKKVARINLVGNIVEVYESQAREDGRKYIFLTLDDGSGQIKLKAFGDDSEKFSGISQGQTVTVIGMLKNWNNETYVAPEIIKEVDPRYLLLRKMETEREKTHENPVNERSQIVAIKDRILGLVKDADDNGGLDLDKLIMELNGFSPAIINQEIQKLLEEGIIFEPRPGKIRYLG